MIIRKIENGYFFHGLKTPNKVYTSTVTPPFSKNISFGKTYASAIEAKVLGQIQQKFITKDKTRLGVNFNPRTGIVNFKVASKNAEKVFLCVFDEPKAKKPYLTLPMEKNKDVWQTSVPIKSLGGKNKPIYYGYRAFGENWRYSEDFFDENGNIKNPKAGFNSIVDEKGNRFNPNKIASDPCGRELSHLPSDNPDGIPAFFSTYKPFEDNSSIAPKSVFTVEVPTLLSKTTDRALVDEVIGEVHIKDLSINEDVDAPGTFLGAGQMAKKVKEAGISMVEFLPLQEFDHKEGYDGNYWGYMTLGFFAPAKKYSSDKTPGGSLREFRKMVDAYHKENIKVCMDVVYNHTGEGANIGGEKDNAKQMSFALLDNQMYYKQNGGYYNQNSGCGNDINAADSEVMEMIADSIAFWANQGVDAFRFDLAAGLLDTKEGNNVYFDTNKSIVGKLAKKLEKKGIKVKAPDEKGPGITLIAEPWTCVGDYAYQIGNFPTNWAEWNDKFRETIKKVSHSPFEYTPRQLRDALEGSRGVMKAFNKSVNYTNSHDGYTLADNNELWRYGGDSGRRENEIKKQIALTLLAQGTPMLQVGDIIAHSKGGNNNTYCLDDDTNYLDFSKINDSNSLEYRIYDFTKNMIDFRNSHDSIKTNQAQIQYFKPDGSIAHDWDNSYWNNTNSNIMCYKVNDKKPLFVSVSSDANFIDVKLPKADDGKKWYKVCDSAREDSFGVLENTSDVFIQHPYSIVLFEQR